MGIALHQNRRRLSNHTSFPWRESTGILLALGLCSGCSDASRPPAAHDEPPAIPEQVVKPEPTGMPPGAVTATGAANGQTTIQVALFPGITIGDVLHLRTGERIVATALVTEVRTDSIQAIVTGLTDRMRPVSTGDLAERVPPEALIAPLVATPTAVVVPPPPAPAEPDPFELFVEEVMAMPDEAPATPETTAATNLHPEAPATDPLLTPDTRARLSAERAYFLLSSRVLRLPPASPELAELQEKVREELANLEFIP